MKIVQNPEVFLIGYPTIDTGEMLRYLREVGGEGWFRRVFGTGEDAPAAEGLAEFYGRLCYRSWEPGLNKNVVKIREDRGHYLANILKQTHGSVLEHAVFNFVIHNASRVLVDELRTHRIGTASSVESLRYVRLDELTFRLPPVLGAEAHAVMTDLVQSVEEAMGKLAELEIADDSDFARKKIATSAIRRIAPLGLATEYGWSSNVRTLRHVIEVRSAESAEEEIRVFGDQVARLMKAKAPLLFADYVEEYGAWVTEWRKV